MSETTERSNEAIASVGVSMAEATAGAQQLQSFVALATIQLAAVQMHMFGQMLTGEYTGRLPRI